MMQHARRLRPLACAWALVLAGGLSAGLVPPLCAETGIPTAAATVIRQVYAAAKAGEFATLETLMVRDFLWSFGGDGDSRQAIEAWRADPQALRALIRVTASTCEALADGSVECPRKAGVHYRARFVKTPAGWRMGSFVAGD